MLKKNIIANYASQIYVAVVGVVLLPIYIKYMGSEAYGLIGFYTMLQAWFSLLDLGLTPTISRETARYRAGAMSSLAFRQLYRVLLLIFCLVSLVGGSFLYLFSDQIVSKWLSFEYLAIDEVIESVQIISIIVALRWMTGLYKGVISGTELFVWLSGFNVLFVTLRFGGVFLSMNFLGFTPKVFFVHQLIVALLEIIILSIKCDSVLPNKKSLPSQIGWSVKPVKSVLKFSLTIAFTASIWIIVTQSDKLVLSGILSLENYGYFTLGVLVANGIMIIGVPISNAIMPRMAKLHAENNHELMISVYRKSTQFVAIAAGSSAITMVITAKQLLFAWTGEMQLAERTAPILQLYSLGNLFLSLSAFGYYLQYAKGQLKYHFIGNLGFGVVLIPSIIFTAIYFGALGAAFVWFVINALFLFLWVAYIHHKLEPKFHLKWLTLDILQIIIPAAVAGLFCWGTINYFQQSSRIANFLVVVFSGSVILLTSLIFSTTVRSQLRARVSMRND